MGWVEDAHKTIDEFTKDLKDRLIYGTKRNKEGIEDAAKDVNIPEPPKKDDEGFKKVAKK